MATKSYIRGFPRYPEIDTRIYMVSTNAILLSADAQITADGANPATDILDISWIPFNNAVFCVVFYKTP